MNREEVMAMDFDEFKEFMLDRIEWNYKLIEKQSELNEKSVDRINRIVDQLVITSKIQAEILSSLMELKKEK